MNKICSYCGVTYDHPRQRRQCTPCLNKYHKEYKRKRRFDPSYEHARIRQREYDARKEVQDRRRENAKLIIKKDGPERIKYLCRKRTNRMKKKGLIQQTLCVKCGGPSNEVHHLDYRDPLNVVWYCTPCHRLLHQEGNAYVPVA